MRVALLGTRGVPARYGGFETCIEEVGSRLATQGYDVTVYCRAVETDEEPRDTYRGMNLVHLPAARRRSIETLSHTSLSVAHLLRAGTDAAIMFNAANAPLLPALRVAGIPVATHVDGLEWLRGKWGKTGRQYYRRAEEMAVRWSDALIADAPGIQDYYASAFGAATVPLAYGAPLIEADQPHLLDQVGLNPRGYHLAVARFEPENNLDTIVAGYTASSAELPLVVVGAAPYADEYTAYVRSLADERTVFLGSVWDQELLDQLFANAATYLHGHSVGGTNPALLRAAGAAAPTIAFDVVFNADVLGQDGLYFRGAPDLAAHVMEAEVDPDGTYARGKRLQGVASEYNWDGVAEGYAKLLDDLASGRFGDERPSGRRLREWTPDQRHAPVRAWAA